MKLRVLSLSRLFTQNPTRFLGFAFGIVVALTALLTTYGITQLDKAHASLETVLDQHETKIHLVQTLRAVVRERAIAMHQLAIEEDPFKRDEIILRFQALAGQFVTARNQLEKSAQADERQMFARLRELAMTGTPYQESVITLLSQDKLAEARQVLREQAMPAQFSVIEQCDVILQHYRDEAIALDRRVEEDAKRTRLVMLVLSALVIVTSIAIATIVVARVNRDRKALQLANDTLEQQVAERTTELRQSVAQLAEAQRISHVGHWEWWPDTDRMTWSDEVYRILGLAPQSWPANYENLLSVIWPDDKEKFTEAIEQARADRASFDLVQRIVRLDGTERIVRQRATVEMDEQGHAVKILGTLQDVTEAKRTEQSLRMAASVFANAGEGIIITDAENNIVDVNQTFTEITGFSREDVVGKNPRIFKSEKHDPSFYREMWNTLLETGQWRGELWGRRKTGTVYPKWQTINVIRDDNGDITNFLAMFHDISDAKRHEEQLWALAHYDNLCGVANRSLMYANLRQAIASAKRDKHQVALMLFDLDRFKQINDTLGHDAGDQLLVHVARQLSVCVRDTDTVARLGGDEFTVILSNIHHKDNVTLVVEKIRKALAVPLTLKAGDTIAIGASIGIALYPTDAPDIETLMKNADRAMYTAKELGRNNYQFFSEGMSMNTKPQSPVS